MTKIVNLFDPTATTEQKKPIQFEKCLYTDGTIVSINGIDPTDWLNISLLVKDGGLYDIMYAWDEDPNDGVVYLGKWNDGVVG